MQTRYSRFYLQGRVQPHTCRTTLHWRPTIAVENKKTWLFVPASSVPSRFSKVPFIPSGNGVIPVVSSGLRSVPLNRRKPLVPKNEKHHNSPLLLRCIEVIGVFVSNTCGAVLQETISCSFIIINFPAPAATISDPATSRSSMFNSLRP